MANRTATVLLHYISYKHKQQQHKQQQDHFFKKSKTKGNTDMTKQMMIRQRLAAVTLPTTFTIVIEILKFVFPFLI